MGKRNRLIAGLGSVVATACLLLSCWPPRAEAAPPQAPEFVGITHWINSKPLTMKALRGKVVLIDFWAYSCINCLRTFPHVTGWYAKYKDKGLVVVGVHSPEFTFGQDPANVERAVKRFGITYPVAMDSHMATWRAWHNQYWPAEYLVNRQGQVVLHHFGEGEYLAMENAIRQQLGLPPTTHAVAGGPDLAAIASPEMYFGSARQQYQANAFRPPQALPPTGVPPGFMLHSNTTYAHDYQLTAKLELNRFALGGRWRTTPQYAELLDDHGRIRLHFQSGKLYMVASSDKPVTLIITVDGKKQPPVTVHASRLYTLYDSNDYASHVVTIDIPHAGFKAFTFTFG
ncbi:MAG TPA: thioredoxin family protein [Rhodanobacteraceae bacterium]